MLFSRPNTCMNKAMNWVRDISRAFHWLTLASFHYFDIGFTTVVRKIFLYQTKIVKGLSDLLKRSLKNLSLILRCLILPIQKEKKIPPDYQREINFLFIIFFFPSSFIKNLSRAGRWLRIMDHDSLFNLSSCSAGRYWCYLLWYCTVEVLKCLFKVSLKGWTLELQCWCQ